MTKTRPTNYLEGDDAQNTVISILDSLATHPLRSAAAFRNCVLGQTLYAVNPLLDMGKYAERFTEESMRMLGEVVSEGRMIDFGHVPNEVVKAESLRARDAYEAGDLLHPYECAWVGVMSWEGGYNAYYVEPMMPDGSTLVLELYGVSLPGSDAILLYDAVRIEVVEPGDTRIIPAPMHKPENIVGGPDEHALLDSSRAANSLDPLVTMLRLLADASVPVTPVAAPVRLNKQRLKRGQFAIPAHTHVDTKDYVAAFASHAGPRGPRHGGHHASPVAHWRRSHLRRIAPDRVVKVRSSQVNWRSNEEIHRLFYRLPKQETGHAPEARTTGLSTARH